MARPAVGPSGGGARLRSEPRLELLGVLADSRRAVTAALGDPLMADRPTMATQEQRVAPQFTATARQLGIYSAVRERLGYRRRYTP
jgi:hypothetical protein